jgi:hypothetical protein
LIEEPTADYGETDRVTRERRGCIKYRIIRIIITYKMTCSPSSELSLDLSLVALGECLVNLWEWGDSSTIAESWRKDRPYLSSTLVAEWELTISRQGGHLIAGSKSGEKGI